MNIPPTSTFVLGCMAATFDALALARDTAAKATPHGRALAVQAARRAFRDVNAESAS